MVVMEKEEVVVVVVVVVVVMVVVVVEEEGEDEEVVVMVVVVVVVVVSKLEELWNRFSLVCTRGAAKSGFQLCLRASNRHQAAGNPATTHRRHGSGSHRRCRR